MNEDIHKIAVDKAKEEFPVGDQKRFIDGFEKGVDWACNFKDANPEYKGYIRNNLNNFTVDIIKKRPWYYPTCLIHFLKYIKELYARK